jgi:hypothetical protein
MNETWTTWTAVVNSFIWLHNIITLPADFNELTNIITTAVQSVTEDTLRRVWDEFSYRVDVVRAAGGGHMKRL